MEAVNYIQRDGYVVGDFVNHHITVQADSLEELEQNCKYIFEAYLEHLTNTIKKEKPFQFIKVENFIPDKECAEEIKQDKEIMNDPEIDSLMKEINNL